VAARRYRVTPPENLECSRELASAGVMFPLSGFVSGEDANFRFTDFGWAMRLEF
jgi:hypothetical protein